MKINNNSMKKIAAAALICILAAVSFTNVFAQVPGQNNNGFGQMMPPMGGPHGQQMGQDMSGQNNNGFSQMPPMGGPQGQQMGQDINGQNNNGFGQMPPMGGPQNDIFRLQDSINNVSDSDTQSTLQTLLDAYRSILDEAKDADEDDAESYREAASEALEALLTAMNEAGIETSQPQGMPFNGNGQMNPGQGFGGNSPMNGPQQGQPMDQNMPGQNGQMPPMSGPQNDTANLQNAIDEVTDSDTKAALQTLLDAFESAIEAEKNADSDEIESLRQATSEAFEALMTAFKNAGIEPQAQQQPPFNGSGQMPPAPMGQQN